MQTSSISILGCGWLGLPLADFLVKKGFQVYGSTTQQEKLALLQARSIQPFQLVLSPQAEGNDWYSFLANPTLIINIPPQKAQKEKDFHLFQIENLLKLVRKSQVKRIFYVSSTSVYPEQNQIADEKSPTITDDVLVKTEKLLWQLSNMEVVILRCGGLLGYNRIAGKSLAGKPTNTGSMPVNFIHRDDVIHIIFQLLAKRFNKEIFNLVAPLHPTRREVYEAQAEKYGFAPPLFDENTLPYKIVDSTKLQKTLAYEFLHPNPTDF